MPFFATFLFVEFPPPKKKWLAIQLIYSNFSLYFVVLICGIYYFKVRIKQWSQMSESELNCDSVGTFYFYMQRKVPKIFVEKK